MATESLAQKLKDYLNLSEGSQTKSGNHELTEKVLSRNIADYLRSRQKELLTELQGKAQSLTFEQHKSPLEESLAKLAQELSDSNRDIDSFHKQQDQLMKQWKELLPQVQRLSELESRCEKATCDYNESLRQTKAKVESLIREISQLGDTFHQLVSEFSSVLDNRNRLVQSIQDLSKKVDDGDHPAVRDYMNRSDELRAQADRKQDDLDQQHQDLQRLADQNNYYVELEKQRLRNFALEVEEAKNQANEAIEAYNRLAEYYNGSYVNRSTYGEIEDKKHHSQRMISQFEGMRRSYEEEMGRVRHEIEDKDRHFKTLKQDFEGDIARIKEEFRRAQEDLLSTKGYAEAIIKSEEDAIRDQIKNTEEDLCKDFGPSYRDLCEILAQANQSGASSSQEGMSHVSSLREKLSRLYEHAGSKYPKGDELVRTLAAVELKELKLRGIKIAFRSQVEAPYERLIIECRELQER